MAGGVWWLVLARLNGECDGQAIALKPAFRNAR